MQQRPTTPRTVAVIGTRGYPSYYGGFETAVRKLAPFLADAGWDVTVYGRKGTTTDSCPERDARIRTVSVPGIESRSLSTLTHGLTATLHALVTKPDVVLVMNCANGFWLPLLRLRGIPSVVNVDGIEWERAKWGRLARSVFITAARFTARFATRLVFDADAIGHYWRRNFARGGTMIPYGGMPARPAAPVEPGLESGRYALAVARFVPENTVPEFLEAAERIARERDVVIVGSSGYGGELDARAAALAAANPRVHWLGHVDDDRRLHALWQHAGVYFHGHSVGGTNPALVQAMHLGAPTVARDTVYTREVLRDAGQYVDADPDAIADAVLDLLDDAPRRDRMRRCGLERARAHYTWESVCTDYESTLRTVAGARR